VTQRTILIADDDAVAASKLAHRLTSLGYEVAAIAQSAADASALTARLQPEVILMTSALRGDGALAPTTPTVYVVAPDDEAEFIDASTTGQSGHVVAPFTDRELRATIEMVLCRRDAARAVHELEDRFFAESIDMLCCLDFSGYFKRLNPAWERTLGFTRAELMSKPFIEFVHPDDRERTLRQNREVRGGGQALSFENRYLCKDGSWRWFHWNAASDSGARVIYSVARDVTASKQAEEERDRLVGRLQAALAEVRRLREILPICSYCRKIRDDENYWLSVEDYLARHTTTQFSHGICPSCMESEVGPELGAFGCK
jgi:PAS domain S-box-containing protein